MDQCFWFFKSMKSNDLRRKWGIWKKDIMLAKPVYPIFSHKALKIYAIWKLNYRIFSWYIITNILHFQYEKIIQLESKIVTLKTSRKTAEKCMAMLEKKMKLKEKTKLIGNLLSPLFQVKSTSKSSSDYR
jgi:hypothetical protein